MADVVKTTMFRPEVYLTIDEDGFHTLSVNWVDAYENTILRESDEETFEDEQSTEWMDSVIAYSTLQFVHDDGSTTIVKDVRDV